MYRDAWARIAQIGCVMPDVYDQCDSGDGECPDMIPATIPLRPACYTCGEDPLNGPCPPDCLPPFKYWYDKANADGL
jgi:hypothetical protein